MNRICSICDTIVKDDRLIACPNCNHPLSKSLPNIIDPRKDSSHDFNASIKSLTNDTKFLWKISFRVFLGFFALFGIIAAITGWSILGTFKSIEKNINERIEEEFKEPNIKNTIKTVAENKSQELLATEIKPVLDDFNNSVSNVFNEFHSFKDSLKFIENSILSRYAEIESIYNNSSNKLENIDIAFQKIGDLEKVLAKASELLIEVSKSEKFLRTLLNAMNDNRDAFFELKEIAKNKDDKYSNIAFDAFVNLLYSIEYSEKYLESLDIVWEDIYNFEIDTISFSNLENTFSQLENVHKPGFINAIYGSKKYSRKEKLDFLYYIIKNDNSCRAVSVACRLMDRDAKLKKNFSASNDFIKWWEKNRDSK